jgi:hypothetical protein
VEERNRRRIAMPGFWRRIRHGLRDHLSDRRPAAAQDQGRRNETGGHSRI